MIETFLSQPWVQKLGWTLLHFLWQGTAIALLYAVLRALMGRVLFARGRYVLACLALTAMMAAPLLTFFLLPGGGDDIATTLTAIPWKLSASEWQSLLPGLVTFWLAGVLIFSFRLFAGLRFAARLRTTSHPAPAEWQRTLEGIAVKVQLSRPVRLLVSSLVQVPTVIGWLRPAILLPMEALTGLPPEYLAALLAHEMAHIRRHDYLASVLQSIAETVLFYHPAVWWISEQIRAEREACCDDLAVAVSGDVVTYVRALAELESQQMPRLRAVLAANGGSLVNRIQRLIEPSQAPANYLPGAGAAWAMTLLWLAGVGVATIHAAPTPLPALHVMSLNSGAVGASPAGSPSPFPAEPALTIPLAGHARSAVLFDPFLSAQAAEIPARVDTGEKEESAYRKWLNDDVAHIISAEERKAFLQSNTDEERAEFVEQFWLRRDPTPGTEENEYKEEHYRRIAYANEHFGWQMPGSQTDRGRMYITLGPPDEIQPYRRWNSDRAPESPDGIVWIYRNIAGTGNDTRIMFSDPLGTGNYQMAADQVDGLPLAPGSLIRAQRPRVRFQDLEAAAGTQTNESRLPMKVEVDYWQGTGSATMVNITSRFEGRDLQFQINGGIQKAVVNLFGRVTSMTRRPITTFEPTLEVNMPAGGMAGPAAQLYQQSVPLPPGRYRLNLVAKDIFSGNVNSFETELDVPHFDADKLGASSLVLADVLQKLPTKPMGGTMFAIGDSKVRPRVGNTFARTEKMGIYLQVYNFAAAEAQSPVGSVEYEIDRAGTTDKVVDVSEEVGSIQFASASQVTLMKLLPLTSLQPGQYTMRVMVTDRNANQTVQRVAAFTVSGE